MSTLMSYAFHLQLEKINKQPLVCEGAGGPTRFFSAVRVHVMVHQGAKDPQSHTNVKHEDDRDAPASRPERHLTLPLKTPRGGGRVEPFANHSLHLRIPQRCDGPPVRVGVTRTFPGMDGGGGGVRTDLRSAARAKVWGRGFTAIGAEAAFLLPILECNLVFYRVQEPAGCGALGGSGTARTAWFGPDGATRSLW